jgi:lipase maturation factor 1
MVPLRRTLDAFRSMNAYHLFAQMTLVRNEVVIEGSDDGARWLPYEFRYKPGDVNRAPAVIAPHQPRVDFQLWFLLLGGRATPRYFDSLLASVFNAPQVVAPLFARDPFPDKPPAFVRVAVYRYRFSDIATRRATGTWWDRELIGYSTTMTSESFRRRRAEPRPGRTSSRSESRPRLVVLDVGTRRA